MGLHSGGLIIGRIFASEIFFFFLFFFFFWGGGLFSGGLIFGGAYYRNFTVPSDLSKGGQAKFVSL